ncbi:MAG: isochorismatase family protein [Opitutales bacterium]
MPDPIQHLGLLCLDLQDPFLKAIPERTLLLERCAFAIEAAKLLGLTIAVTEQMPDKLSGTTESIRTRLPANTPVFDKQTFSALEAAGLDRWIQTNQLDHLLLIGIETPICIYQTAVQALGDELGVTLLADCIGQRRHADRAPVLQQLLAMDAHILPSETIFYSLLGSANHPQFREYTRLVKTYTTPPPPQQKPLPL